jgi:hypothetical protein
MLASELSTPSASPRRGTLGRVVVIVAVTVAITGSLGVAGAIGYASSSVHAFGKNVEHIFSPPGPQQTTSSNSGRGSTNGHSGSNNNGDNNGTNANGDNNNGDNGGNGDPFTDPFHFVYGNHLPICDPQNNLEFVSFFEWFRDIVTPGFSFPRFDPSTHTFFCPQRHH